MGGGGAELQAVLLARALSERGLDVGHVVYPLVDQPSTRVGVPTLVERAAPSREHALAPAREARHIWRALTRADARVVVVRGSGGYVVPAAAWCRLHRRFLVLATSNDLDFDLHRPDRNRATLRAYSRAARRADRLVVQTGHQAELARAAFPALEPILIPSFAEPAEPVPAERSYFLWSDRLTGYKRPEKYLDLAAALPEASFRMIVAETRETSAELRDRVRARAAQLPNLELANRRSRPELLQEIGHAVAVVKTSEVEGMPNTFLEAWARGVPVLSLSVDPDRRIAEHGGGLLANGSTDRFAEQARRLWEQPALRDELGTQGRELVRSHHSLRSIGDRWFALLRELLPEGS